ncbi:MAG: TolC family protein [Gemmatimonadetes bacterium]|nr:TolC family protein [Gemmatimonadota bacterium]
MTVGALVRSRAGTSCVFVMAAAAAWGGPVAAQEPGAVADSVGLGEALELALIVSPALAQSTASLSQADGSRRMAWGSFLPNVNLSSGASVQSSSQFDPGTQRVVSGSSDSYNAGLSANYQIFQGGRRFNELDRSSAGILEAEARLEDQRFSVLLQTRTFFMNALRQDELVRVAEGSVSRAEESLDITRRRVQVGTGTRSDSLRTRLELANARQALLQARNQLRASRFALGRQIGADGPVVPLPPGNLDPAPLALREVELVELAQSVSPAVRAAEAAASVADASVGSARASYLPNINLSSGYTWANNQASFDGGNTSWNFRLSGSYPLFNGFQREEQVSQASESRRVARLQEEDARRGVRQDVDAALRTLETQEQAIEIAREAVAVAEEDLRLNRERYRVGVATILDVITSQVALDQAEADLVSARYDYVLAKAELESIVGREL